LSGFSRAAVKVLVAAALILWTCSAALAAVKVEGVPSWLEAAATRSMAAVWGEIDPRQGEETRLAVVKLVAARLFEGYSVGSAEMAGSDLHLVLNPKQGTAWEVEGGIPSLPVPFSEWMSSDWQLARNRISDLVSGFPLEALNWADAALRLEVADILSETLPGWRGSLIVRLEENRSILKVGLSPEQPVILAVTPRISSTSLPTLLHSDLKEDLLRGLSPLIGLPVAWAARHERQVAEWTTAFLGEQSRVENLKIGVTVQMKPQPVTDLAVRLESRRYTIWAWVAGYAGTSDRYPEAGVHLGRKAQLFPRWDVELYGEALFYLNDWDLETRLGFRWSPWDRIWLGVERSWPDEATWWRVWFDGPVRAPYAWIRGSEEGNVNLGIGYRLNENLSIELHYDDRDENSSSVRLVGNL
jgi:hypothetical protein